MIYIQLSLLLIYLTFSLVCHLAFFTLAIAKSSASVDRIITTLFDSASVVDFLLCLALMRRLRTFR